MSDLEGHVTSTFVVDDPGIGIGDAPPANSRNICQRSGFLAKPAELKEEWNGVLVLPEFFEERNHQDFVKGRAEPLDGSLRPESPDKFLEVNEVTASDL